MTHDHEVITFEGNKGIVIEECPHCHKQRWLGSCGDGCKICQGCFHRENGLAPLPSDSQP